MNDAATPPPGPRRLGGWGFEGLALPASPQLLAWLEARLGPAAPPSLHEPTVAQVADPAALPELPVRPSTEPLDRLAHARGQGLTDLLRLRSGRVLRTPDGVCRPTSSAEVEDLLRSASAAGCRVVPWGGGTSVTGGVNVPTGPEPVISLDLERLAGLLHLDPVSGLATFAAGSSGPQVEGALGETGLTLGHYPQSWELSTVGGWVAARSSGQESLGFGRIEDLVAGLRLVAPAGRLDLQPLPASAAGPDLRQLVLGSEGRLGVITEATLRVRPRPCERRVTAWLLPCWEAGLDAARDLVQSGVGLSLLRLSDGPETEVAMAVGMASSRAGGLVRAYLRARGAGAGACLLLVGATGEPQTVRSALGSARSILGRHRAVALGQRPGRKWLEDRFRHPYLRDDLLARGYATDTLETATSWSALRQTSARVGAAISGALSADGEAVAVLCHVSHPYIDGASLYFTFFFRCTDEVDATVERWAAVKRAATSALVACGATVSHHHGVGQWHAPWLGAEIGSDGQRVLHAAARELDPAGCMNPHVLLDPRDRLEV